jgi:hypothetical protein
LNENSTINNRRILNGEYEMVKEGRYSSALISLMGRMMDMV